MKNQFTPFLGEPEPLDLTFEQFKRIWDRGRTIPKSAMTSNPMSPMDNEIETLKTNLRNNKE